MRANTQISAKMRQQRRVLPTFYLAGAHPPANKNCPTRFETVAKMETQLTINAEE
jgi:hypothetical protein